jgi:hypothetical protein
MKRIVAVLLSLALICSMSASAFGQGFAGGCFNCGNGPFVGGGGGSLTFNVGNGGAVHTFSGAPTLPNSFSAALGPPTSDRIAVVGISWDGASSGANSDMTTVTVGGVTLSAAPAVGFFTSQFGSGVWLGLIGTSGGATPTVTVTSLGGTGWVNEAVVSVGYVTGSATASVASTVSTGYQAASVVNSAGITVPTGGVAILNGFSGNSPGTATTAWTNATKDTDGVVPASTNTAGSLAHATASATVTQTVTNNGSNGNAGWVGIVLQP